MGIGYFHLKNKMVVVSLFVTTQIIEIMDESEIGVAK